MHALSFWTIGTHQTIYSNISLLQTCTYVCFDFSITDFCFNIGYSKKEYSTTPTPLVDFDRFENVGQAFQDFTTVLTSLLRIPNIATIRRACILQGMGPFGITLPDVLSNRIQSISKIDDLIDELTYSGFMTWIDTRLVEAMAAASTSSTPKPLDLVKQYKNFVYRKKLSEILTDFPDPETKMQYVAKVSIKVNKFVSDVTVKELLNYKKVLEIVVLDVRQGSLSLSNITEGCIEMHCYIAFHLLAHAYQSSLRNANKFSSLHIRYLEFQGYPRIYSLENTKQRCGGLLLSLPSTGM